MSEREVGPEMYVKQGKYIPVVYVQGEPLSNEEREAAAVFVACMRRGWKLHQPIKGQWVVIGGRAGRTMPEAAPRHRGPLHITGPTPLKAYAAALKATQTEDEQ